MLRVRAEHGFAVTDRFKLCHDPINESDTVLMTS